MFCGGVALLQLATPFFLTACGNSLGLFSDGRGYNFFWILIFTGMFVVAIRMLWRAMQSSEGIERERAERWSSRSASPCWRGSIFFRRSASTSTVRFRGDPRLRDRGGDAVWRYQLVDITPEYAAGQILETMKSAVIVIDMDGRFASPITRVERCSATEPALLGKHLRRSLDPSENMTTGQLLNSPGVLEQQMVWRTAPGTRDRRLATSSFVRDDEGAPVGVVYVATTSRSAAAPNRRCARASTAIARSSKATRCRCGSTTSRRCVHRRERRRGAALRLHQRRISADDDRRHPSAGRCAGDARSLRRAATAASPTHLPSPEKGRRGLRRRDHLVRVPLRRTAPRLVIARRRHRAAAAPTTPARERGALPPAVRAQPRRRLPHAPLDGRILDCNDAWRASSATRPRGVAGAAGAIALLRRRRARPRASRSCASRARSSNVEVRMRRRDGTPVWVSRT